MMNKLLRCCAGVTFVSDFLLSISCATGARRCVARRATRVSRRVIFISPTEPTQKILCILLGDKNVALVGNI